MLKHLRKIKRIYKKKNLLIATSFKDTFNDKLEIINSDSGLHIVCEANTCKDEKTLREHARKLRILLNIISKNENKIIFSLNYSGISMNKIQDFTNLLGKVLFEK